MTMIELIGNAVVLGLAVAAAVSAAIFVQTLVRDPTSRDVSFLRYTKDIRVWACIYAAAAAIGFYVVFH